MISIIIRENLRGHVTLCLVWDAKNLLGYSLIIEYFAIQPAKNNNNNNNYRIHFDN